MLIGTSLLALALTVAPNLAVDLEGQPVTQLIAPGEHAAVLFFTASDCPISNRYVPEMQRLAAEFAPSGVRVWFVYPNPGDTAAVVRAHDAEFAVTAKVALDQKQTLTRMAHATTTPEAVILVPEGTTMHEVYRGRIDDLYLTLGQERPHATRHDLEAAIRAVLAHTPVSVPGGPPVGCSIVTLQP